MSGVTYEVTAKFDDGLYRIVDNEWVASERWYRPKTVDFRSAFSLCPLETPEIDQKEHKMDRFKRFLGKFALYFGICVLGAVIAAGVFAGILQIQAMFGVTAAVIAILSLPLISAAALTAWFNS